jgi:hypothetical protein
MNVGENQNRPSLAPDETAYASERELPRLVPALARGNYDLVGTENLLRHPRLVPRVRWKAAAVVQARNNLFR